MSIQTLYLIAWSLVAITPGPAVVCVMSQAARYGARAARMGVLGIQLGSVSFFACIGLGNAALLNPPNRSSKTIPDVNPFTKARLQGRASMNGRFCLATVAAFLLFASQLQAGEGFSQEVLIDRQSPRDRRWEIVLETAGLFGVRNPNNYVIAPQLLSVAWQPFSQWQIGPVHIRGQILATFLGEAILHGPESYFLGGALRVRLAFLFGTSRWSLYVDGGGGMGGIDSDDTPLGQGEDFAFCLLASGGVRFSISNAWSVWAGFLWQHLSNADLSEPRRRNTALDTIGPVAGVSYAF